MDNIYLILGLWGTGGLKSEATTAITRGMETVTVDTSVRARFFAHSATVVGMLFLRVFEELAEASPEVEGT